MIKKLRRKFTLITLLLSSLVLLTVLTVSTVSTVRQQIDLEELAMSNLLSQPDGGEIFPGPDGPAGPQPDGGEVLPGPGAPDGPSFYTDPGKAAGGVSGAGAGGAGRRGFFDRSFTPALLVSAADDGTVTVLRSQTLSLDSDDLQEAVSQILASGKTSGTVSGQDLRFRVTAGSAGTLIALADRSTELSVMRSSLVSSGLIFAGAFLLLFVISLFLSRWALAPVEASWKQQRQFIADASHELKTPLTVILANLNILKAHPDQTVREQERWVDSTQEEAGHMKKLVEDLLFLARADAERLPEKMSEVNLSDLLTEAELAFEPVAFERGVMIEDEIEPGLTLTGDASQLRQLAVILIDNACKYASVPGTVRLGLQKENDRLRLTVSNPGPDLSPEAVSHLFERFYRADEARTRNGSGGYGLGLSIAKTITEHHGGHILARSEGGLTTFTVTFPVK